MNTVTLKPRRLGAITALAVIVAVVVGGCAPATKASTNDVLTVAASAAVTTWDPIQSFSTEALYLGNLYETLIWKNPAGAAKAFSPGLASSWSSSTDGKTWTFHLRKGATFHDGEAVDAAAVKGSILASQARGGASFIWAPLASIDTPDSSTVVFNLSYSAPLDLIAASTYGSWIVAPKALAAEATNNKYFEKGIDAGSGPYTLASYTPGSEVVLKKYNKYWNKAGASHYKVVDISITPDAVTALQMLNAGSVDLSTSIPLDNIKSLQSNPKYTVKSYNSPFNFTALFNTTRAPLNNVLVRQALSYAIPYQDIINIGGQGFGTQSHGPVPKGIFPYSASVPAYKQDLAKAAALLAQAGHKGGGFSLKLTYASENPAEAKFVPLIKDAFAKIGVTVNVRPELFNQQWADAKKDPKNAQDIFVLYYWPTYSDAGVDNLRSLFYYTKATSFNLSYWKNDAYDTLLDQATPLTGSDKNAAAALYQKAEGILYDQAPGAFLYDLRDVQVVPKGISVPAFNENYPFTVFFAPIKPTA